MIKVVFAPALALMNSISYPLKLTLVTALFAVPLSMTLIDTMVNQQKEMQSIEEKHKGIQLINQFMQTIVELEALRDMAVLARQESRNTGITDFNLQKKKTLELLIKFTTLTR